MGLSGKDANLIVEEMRRGAHPKDAAMAALQPGEVLVSSTVKDLVAGSGIRFGEGKTVQLKGVPGEWSLYQASPPPAEPVH